MAAGADKPLLKEKKLHKEHLEAAAEAGRGQLVKGFKDMHAAIMEKAKVGNRWGPQPSAVATLPSMSCSRFRAQMRKAVHSCVGFCC